MSYTIILIINPVPCQLVWILFQFLSLLLLHLPNPGSNLLGRVEDPACLLATDGTASALAIVLQCTGLTEVVLTPGKGGRKEEGGREGEEGTEGEEDGNEREGVEKKDWM